MIEQVLSLHNAAESRPAFDHIDAVKLQLETKLQELGGLVASLTQTKSRRDKDGDRRKSQLLAKRRSGEERQWRSGLGLQEVGMRWAWMDGVTYQDWQKYHKLRNTLSEWQAEVEAVGSRHDGLRLAHEEAAKLEDKAMSTASTMVNELVRLKDVSKWKIWAEDASDDFSDNKVPPRVFKAAQQVIENAQEVPSKASEAVLGSETPATESLASTIKESVSSVSSELSENIVGSETPAAESLASNAKDSVSTASSKLSENILGSETPASESLASELKSQISKPRN